MRKYWIFIAAVLLLFPACQKENRDLFTIGLFQVDDAPTLNSVRKGFISALEEAGLMDGMSIRMVIRNGMGSIEEVQRIAQEYVSSHVDLIVPLSTPCLQAALHASSEVPIVFSSIANPFLTRNSPSRLLVGRLCARAQPHQCPIGVQGRAQCFHIDSDCPWGCTLLFPFTPASTSGSVTSRTGAASR